MSEEVEVVAVEPAPEQVATAAPVNADDTPEAEKVAPKTFTQEELDAAIGKRLAREQRKWEREMALRSAQAAPVAQEIPPADQFDSVDAYADALATQKAEAMLSKREFERRQVELLNAYHERVDEAIEKYPDYQQVVENPSLPVTNVMAASIRASEIGPDVAYYLGSNPKEADRISRLPDFLQAKEIGKLEAKLAASPPVRKTSSAPPPIAPVTSRQSSAPSYDTTDPRSVKSMSTSEWIEAERQRQRMKWEAQRR